MDGRHLLLSLLFLLPCCVLSTEWLGDSPMYLIPVLSEDGKTTKIGECVGSLITLSHIIAPASCLHIDGKLAAGVFIDYRKEKTYPEDESLYPISEYTFSKKISVHEGFNLETLDKNMAIITLPVPFAPKNQAGIKPAVIAQGPNGEITATYFQRVKTNGEMMETVVTVQELAKNTSGAPLKDSVLVMPPKDSRLLILGVTGKIANDGAPIFTFNAECEWIKKIIKQEIIC